MLSVLTIILWRNILISDSLYKDLTQRHVYLTVNEESMNANYNLDRISYLIDNMKLYLENVSYSNGNLVMSIRVNDKKDIYTIVDNLKKDSFSVNSYVYRSEENGTHVYSVNIEV